LGHNGSRSPLNTGLKTGTKSGRGYRIVAGPEPPRANFLIPSDPVHEPESNRAFREHLKTAAGKALFQRTTAPVNIIGGFKFPNPPPIDLSRPTLPSATAAPCIGDGLDIPEFLRRSKSEPAP
jgi:hypothetical protein